MTSKYLQFVHGLDHAVAPFEREIDRLREAELTADPADTEAYDRLFNELIVAKRHYDIAKAEYAGIPSTPNALAELDLATCGLRRSAYAYMVMDDLPDDYCAD
jgi:hypothetical protein